MELLVGAVFVHSAQPKVRLTRNENTRWLRDFLCLRAVDAHDRDAKRSSLTKNGAYKSRFDAD